MGYLTLGILGFSVLALLFGMLVGCLRGRNRALLRLGLLVLTILLAFLLRGVVYDFVAAYEFEHEEKITTLPALIADSFAESFDGSAPEAITDLAITLVEILVGISAFILLFIVIRLITWLIVFPILKIFVKRGEKRRRGIGALVGLLQGALVAFVICAPITGLLVQTDRLSKIEMDGEPIVEIPAEIGLREYLDSAPGTVYHKAGGWFFGLLSTAESSSGAKVSIEDTCEVLELSQVFMEKGEQLTSKLEALSTEGATVEDRIDALKGVGDTLVELGNSFDSLSGDAKSLAEDLIGDIADYIGDEGDETSDSIAEMLKDFEFDDVNFVAAGEAVNSIATVIEKDGATPLTSDEAGSIVNGFAENTFLLDLIAPEGEEPPTLLELSSEDTATVESAISSSTLSAEQRDTLRALLGIS